jgi:hypothetical protein
MVKRIFDLCFTKNKEFVVYKRYSVFGFFVMKKEMSRFKDVEEALHYFKDLDK